MIYKINFLNSSISYDKFLKCLNNSTNYCYSSGYFYVNYDKDIKNILKSDIEFSIIKNTKDVSDCSDLVKKWCEKILYEEAILNFEQSDEGQKRMSIIMKYLDEIEKKRGEVDSAGKKESK